LESTDCKVGIGEIDFSLLDTDARVRELAGRGIPFGAVLPDWMIRKYVTITPFTDYDRCPKGVISYGLSSAGYDLRVGYKFKVFTNSECAIVDPKNMNSAVFRNFDITPHNNEHVWDGPDGHPEHWPHCVHCTQSKGVPNLNPFCSVRPPTPDHILIPPNCFALAETIEHLSIPRNIMTLCLGKSTYARCGINMNFTPFEPGWRGIVTVEIINSTPNPVKIYAGEGIGQAVFFFTAAKVERSYDEKPNAKYQDQTGLTLPSVTPILRI
jgi:dCTP deaminase